jgi:hypothetical protein
VDLAGAVAFPPVMAKKSSQHEHGELRLFAGGQYVAALRNGAHRSLYIRKRRPVGRRELSDAGQALGKRFADHWTSVSQGHALKPLIYHK